MAEFFKKNMVMVVILGVALCAAIVMALFDFDAYWDISTHIKSIENGDKKIQKINRTGRKAPGAYEFDPESKLSDAEQYEKWDKARLDTRIVRENAYRIRQDADALKEKTWQTQRVYGHFYDEAFKAFLDDLKLTMPKPAATIVVKPAEAAKPAEVAKSIEVAKPAEVANPAEAAKPVEVAKPAEVANPAEAAKPVEVAKSAEAVKPAEAAKSVEVAKTSPEEIAAREINSEKWSELDKILTAHMEQQTLHGVIQVFQKLLPKDTGMLRNITAKEQKDLFLSLRSAMIKAPESVQQEDRAAYEVMAGLRFNRAFQKFREEIQKLTVENMLDPADPRPATAAFLQVLGLQRSMNGTDFMTYNEEMQKHLLQMDSIPLIVADRKAEITAIMMNIGKGELVQIPPKENIPHIVRRFQIYEDLFARMKKAQISTLIKLAPGNDGLFGKVKGKYRYYTFDCAIRGTMPQLRTFFNDLQQAYHNNRVYCLTAFSLSLLQASGTSGSQSEIHSDIAQAFGMCKSFGRSAKTQKAGSNLLQPAKQTDITDDPLYGAVFLGINNEVVANFTIEYVIYVGDSIPNEVNKR